jgi:hypothetical protein
MMEILGTLIAGVFGGGATGLLGVIIQRYFDTKAKAQEIEVVKLNHANAIALAGIESARAQKVAEVRAGADTAVAQADTQARETEADERSLIASLQHDAATYLDKGAQRRKGFIGGVAVLLMAVVDFARGILRPGMTIYLCYVVTEMFFWVRHVADKYGNTLTADQIMQLMVQIIATILYVFTTATLWWFGTRPPKKVGNA